MTDRAPLASRQPLLLAAAISSLKTSARLRVPDGVCGSVMIKSVHCRAAVRSPDFHADSARISRALCRKVRSAAVNGAAGAVIFVAGEPTAVMGFVVRGGRIATIDVLADPERIARIDLRAVTA